jgi:hypothetical protein
MEMQVTIDLATAIDHIRSPKNGVPCLATTSHSLPLQRAKNVRRPRSEIVVVPARLGASWSQSEFFVPPGFSHWRRRSRSRVVRQYSDRPRIGLRRADRTKRRRPPHDDGRANRKSATRNSLTRSMIAVGPVREVRIDLQRARRESAASMHFSAGPGWCSFACRCGRDSDPGLHASQQMCVGPRRANRRARIDSTQTLGRTTELSETSRPRRRRRHRPTPSKLGAAGLSPARRTTSQAFILMRQQALELINQATLDVVFG